MTALRQKDNWKAKQAEHGALFPLPDLLHLRTSSQAKSHTGMSAIAGLDCKTDVEAFSVGKSGKVEKNNILRSAGIFMTQKPGPS